MKTFFSQWYVVRDVLWTSTHPFVFSLLSLLMDETHRPTARELLSNPWVVSVANQNVRMDKWIREVWS
jgi:hypothetical protein